MRIIADTLIQTFGVSRFHTSAVHEDTYSKVTIIPKIFESDNMVVLYSTDQEGHSSFLSPRTTSQNANPTPEISRPSPRTTILATASTSMVTAMSTSTVSRSAATRVCPTEYIFYERDNCYGAITLRTTKEMMDEIKQPFKSCSIRVQYPSDYNGWGNPPSGSDLVLYRQPWYKGSSSAKLSGKKCHELKGQGVLNFKSKTDQTYTFYCDAGCKGKVLEKSKGPNSRINTYLTPQSVKIE
ncbi:hypothetical protein BG015_004611 [Linnemannia schmuckeri]|uniref:Uncharacterized protein n=1 Tax=Linnemannia schmuckeri TaxID=64567 RepID=A0A9P5S2C9_9FUNG|nr:hypothetical protein BG015_004611 [Linnemannia schmuckeri]